jgi:hypothetical protein
VIESALSMNHQDPAMTRYFEAGQRCRAMRWVLKAKIP